MTETPPGMPARTRRVREIRSRQDFTGYQILQERRWWGWKTVDRVEIPSHVLISLAAVGDTGGWVSPFAAHIPMKTGR